MIKPLLLILRPGAIWEEISHTRPSIGFMLACFLLPWLLVSAVGEGAGMVHWGKWQDFGRLKRFPLDETVVLEAGQLLLSLVVVFASASMVKSVGDTFRVRHTYTEAFAAVAYSLTPLFILRLLNAFTGINPWVSWAIGISLAVAVLYHGLPRMMKPDPSHALGLYFMSAVVLILVTGLMQYITAAALQGDFPKLQVIVSDLAARLPF